jgi:putative SOS response-associated peptidase YedK
MCGRFSITGDLDFYAEYFGVEVAAEPLEKNWNVAPTDPVYVITEDEGKRRLTTMRWGLVPHWATDTRSININARAETADRTPAFRDAFARKRCLIPADGFYEWEPPERGRAPHWVYRADGHPMVFAGLWAARRDPETEDWRRTCSILTTEAQGAVAEIHDRMPVVLDDGVWAAWLDRDLTEPEAVRSLLRPIPAQEIMEHPVSKRVNSVRNNGPDLQAPAEPETLF